MNEVKCLIVDDREENLLVMQALLRRDDVDLLLARSGLEALDLLLTHDVALALVDVQMPEMDGFELAELMRGSERTRSIPLIFVTAGARDPQRVFKGYDSGAVDFLFKPVEPTILRNKADVFFQLHRQKLQIERELKERTATLRMHEMFAAVLGHDLRAPLGAISMAAQVLKKLDVDPRVNEVSTRIHTSSQRMAAMIEDLLDLARARIGGGIPVTLQAMDLMDVVQRVVAEHKDAHPGRAIHVAAVGQTLGEWDGGRIAQLVSNLVGNALQHGAPDAPVEVKVDGTDDRTIVLKVENDGVPDSSRSSTLFDPFQRGPHEVERREGLGLGLYIARQIATAHGGSIDLTVQEGRTVLTVRLIRHADVAASVPAPD